MLGLAVLIALFLGVVALGVLPKTTPKRAEYSPGSGGQVQQRAAPRMKVGTHDAVSLRVQPLLRGLPTPVHDAVSVRRRAETILFLATVVDSILRQSFPIARGEEQHAV